VAAEHSLLGRVYLDWSPMPIVSMTEGAPAAFNPQIMQGGLYSTVTFTDPRFMGDTPLLHHDGHAPPLTGEVVLDASHHVIAEGMDGRFGR
jgi:hypothetical protein